LNRAAVFGEPAIGRISRQPEGIRHGDRAPVTLADARPQGSDEMPQAAATEIELPVDQAHVAQEIIQNLL
jgi:hypothetical protein